VTLTGQDITVEAIVATVSVGLAALVYQGYSFSERSLRDRDGRDQTVEAICLLARRAAFEALSLLSPIIDEVQAFGDFDAQHQLDAQEALEAAVFEKVLPVFVYLQRAIKARIFKRRFFGTLSVLRRTSFISMILAAVGAASSLGCLATGNPPYPPWAIATLSLSGTGLISTCVLWAYAEVLDMRISRLRIHREASGASSS
jgi:hypothetical protein